MKYDKKLNMLKKNMWLKIKCKEKNWQKMKLDKRSNVKQDRMQQHIKCV